MGLKHSRLNKTKQVFTVDAWDGIDLAHKRKFTFDYYSCFVLYFLRRIARRLETLIFARGHRNSVGSSLKAFTIIQFRGTKQTIIPMNTVLLFVYKSPGLYFLIVLTTTNSNWTPTANRKTTPSDYCWWKFSAHWVTTAIFSIPVYKCEWIGLKSRVKRTDASFLFNNIKFEGCASPPFYSNFFSVALCHWK